MNRKVRIALIASAITVVLICVAVFVFFAFFNQDDAYKLVKLGDSTDLKISDFTEQSKLQFHDNGTFQIHIEHKEKGVALTAIGTYTQEKNIYILEFKQGFVRNHENIIIDLTADNEDTIALRKNISCTRDKNLIKFIDHKNQTYYFG